MKEIKIPENEGASLGDWRVRRRSRQPVEVKTQKRNEEKRPHSSTAA